MGNGEESRKPTRGPVDGPGPGKRVRAPGLHALVVLVLVAISFAQRVGQTTFDTKFDLTADPARALGRSLTLWGTQIDFGGIANQGYGYLFPQGTFFLLGGLAQVPDWIVQRSWSALVLVVAYDGARRLARALGIGAAGQTSGIPVIAGLVYALSPRIVGLSGALTGEILPSAVLPWVCLPVVLALAGRMSARRAGLLAGLAVVAMGGVNAAENLVTFALPLFLVLSGIRTQPGRRLALWWAGCTAAACLWWMLPLLLLGKYSPPFLDYIETAATTTRTAGWSTSIRGAEHWLGYIVVGPGQWWQGAHQMSSAPVLVVLGGLIAGLGLLGLTRRAVPYRPALVSSLVLGLVAATAGHGGPAGTSLSGRVRDLLDGPLAPFRNVHKVDPLIRLPLALGFGVLCAGLAAAVAAERHRQNGEAKASARARGAGLVVVVLVLCSAAPAFANTLRQPGWDTIPQAWRDAASWIDHDGPGTTLVLPSTGIGQQSWGWTVDQPVQGLATSAWVARTQIPLVPSTTIRLLDGVEDRLADGSGSSALAATLAAAGVTRVLVRNDIDVSAADVADPQRVAAALASSPGITAASSFGAGLGGGLPMIQIYRVEGATGTPTAVDRADLPLLTGAPEDVITAREAGVVPADGQVRVGLADRGAEPDIVTDGYRRVERTFGRFHDAVSQVMTATEPARSKRKVVDFAGTPGVPKTYATYGDVAGVTASSSAGYADSLGAVRPELGPGSVLDGDPATYWRSGPYTAPRGQYLTLTLQGPRSIGEVTVTTATDASAGVPITRLRITAGATSRDVRVDADGQAQADFTGSAPTTLVRVTVLDVDSRKHQPAVAIREISLAGIDSTRRLQVPDVGAGSRTAFVFATEPPQRACIGGPLGRTCAASNARPGVEQGSLNRDFTAADGGTWDVHGEAVALGSRAAARMLLPLGDSISATTTSVLGEDPAVSAMYAVDGRDETPWLAAPGDLAPRIDLRWRKPRTISRIDLVGSSVPALLPYRVLIEAAGQTREVRVGSGGLGFFTPIRARSARITLYAHKGGTGQATSVGIGELRLAGIERLARPVAEHWRFTSACGLGPALRIGGATYPTSITGTLGDVVEGRRLQWKACGPIRFSAGAQRVEVAATGAFTATSVALVPSRRTGSPVRTRPVVRSSAQSSSMTVVVGTGAEAVLLAGQNANVGWRATLNGHRLRTEVVDGWQQGFVVPAGTGGTVRISFAPQTEYVAALAVGGAAILVLLGLLLLELRRPAALGPPTLVASAPWRRGPWVLLALGAVALLALGGPVVTAAAVLAAWAVRRFGSGPVGVSAAVLVIASAVAAALSSGTRTGTPGAWADVLAALGCGLVAGTLARGRDDRDLR